CYLSPRVLLSFPTRRSSDLAVLGEIQILAGHGWNDDPQRLRQNDQPQHAPAWQAQRIGGFPLPLPHRLNARTHHLGNEGGGVNKDRKSTRLNSSHVKISYAV